MLQGFAFNSTYPRVNKRGYPSLDNHIGTTIEERIKNELEIKNPYQLRRTEIYNYE